uniref:Uncharacterized protein LOC117312978 isoform X2 n=1 Tax=Tursiops truncatus TaxID=9739 RepID=A0A6J3RN38_TURTR|nr:uncharacterized protein LOC117312978 isoform X2 [Tursiops truncatus]
MPSQKLTRLARLVRPSLHKEAYGPEFLLTRCADTNLARTGRLTSPTCPAVNASNISPFQVGSRPSQRPEKQQIRSPPFFSNISSPSLACLSPSSRTTDPPSSLRWFSRYPRLFRSPGDSISLTTPSHLVSPQSHTRSISGGGESDATPPIYLTTHRTPRCRPPLISGLLAARLPSSAPYSRKQPGNKRRPITPKKSGCKASRSGEGPREPDGTPTKVVDGADPQVASARDVPPAQETDPGLSTWPWLSRSPGGETNGSMAFPLPDFPLPEGRNQRNRHRHCHNTREITKKGAASHSKHLPCVHPYKFGSCLHPGATSLAPFSRTSEPRLGAFPNKACLSSPPFLGAVPYSFLMQEVETSIDKFSWDKQTTLFVI